MGNCIDLTGQRFGRLTVIRKNGRMNRNVAWECKCDCGNTKTISSYSLRSGRSQSCGCLNKELVTKMMTTHGKSGTRLHRIWTLMKNRCTSDTSPDYPKYGGRGVTVCDEWLKFDAFYEWSISHGYDDTLSIDRIDNDGNYCPDNCRWATKKQQENNKSTNSLIEYNGETHTIAEWADIKGINYETLRCRIKYFGWSPEKALTK